MLRTRFLFLLALLFAWNAYAQGTYPSKPVRMVVPYPAGGAVDQLARIVGSDLSNRLGQQFVIENRPGASTTIAGELVARSPDDGYTLLWGASTLALNPAIGMKLPYDLEKDFSPVSFVASMPNVFLVGPKSKFKTLGEVIAAAKSGPEFFFASPGIGSTPHLQAIALNLKQGTRFAIVPYKGSPAALQDMIGGNTSFMIDGYIPSGIHASSGKLRALAVATQERIPVLPDVPTVVELGYPEAIGSGDFGLLAPKGTPRPIIDKLNKEIITTLKQPEVRERLMKIGYVIRGTSPEEYFIFLHNETQRWTKVVKASNFKLD